LGLLYAKLKKPKESFEALKKALQVNPKSAAAYNNLAVFLVQYKKYKTALNVLEKAYQTTGIAKFKKAADSIQSKLNK